MQQLCCDSIAGLYEQPACCCSVPVGERCKEQAQAVKYVLHTYAGIQTRGCSSVSKYLQNVKTKTKLFNSQPWYRPSLARLAKVMTVQLRCFAFQDSRPTDPLSQRPDSGVHAEPHAGLPCASALCCLVGLIGLRLDFWDLTHC